MNPFSGHVFDPNGDQLNLIDCAVDLLLHFLEGGVIFPSELADLGGGKIGVVYQLCLTHDNDACDKPSPVPLFAESLIPGGETNFVTVPDGVQLVSFLGAVDVDGMVSLIVEKIDWDAVRVTFIPQDRKNSPVGFGQDFFALGRSNGLMVSSHFSKHGVPPDIVVLYQPE